MLENLNFPSPKTKNFKFFCKAEHHLFAVAVDDDIISDKFFGHSAVTLK
jgi:hypothetical protein